MLLKVENHDRGVTISCSAVSPATGEDNPVSVKQVFNENRKNQVKNE